MEGYNYRDSLAKELVEKRNDESVEPEIARAKAQGYLEAKKNTQQYVEAEKTHREESQQEEIEKKGRDFFIEFSKDKDYSQRILDVVDSLLDDGVLIELDEDIIHANFKKPGVPGIELLNKFDKIETYNIDKLKQEISSRMINLLKTPGGYNIEGGLGDAFSKALKNDLYKNLDLDGLKGRNPYAVQENGPSRQENLSDKMLTALGFSKCLKIPGVSSGNMMFFQPSSSEKFLSFMEKFRIDEKTLGEMKEESAPAGQEKPEQKTSGIKSFLGRLGK